MIGNSSSGGGSKRLIATNQPVYSSSYHPMGTSPSRIKMNKFSSTVSQRSVVIRYVVILLLISICAYFSIEYIDLTGSNGASNGLLPVSPDRSESYNVHILPHTLSDDQLNQLPKDSFSYLAMIDAGSSGCRAHIYRYGKLGSITGPLYILPQHSSRKVKPGLSSFANHPEDAGRSLQGLIDFMKEEVPESAWLVTPIWLKATAGLRMLPTEQSVEILQSVKQFLSNKTASPFLFRDSFAKVIPGIEEGGFGWIAFNYLKRIIGPKRDTSKKLEPYAVIEMGGASAQVSQLIPHPSLVNSIPPEYRFSFAVEGETFNLYTHSYLGYGAEQARELFTKYLKAALGPEANKNDPCLNKGFSLASKRRGLLESIRPRWYQRWIAGHEDAAEEQMPEDTFSTRRLQYNQSKPSNLSSLDASIGTCDVNVAHLFSTITPRLLSGSTDNNSPASCTSPGPFSFGCVHQPSFVAQSTNILAFENFFYVSSALDVPSIEQAPVNTSIMVPTTNKFPLLTTPQILLEASQRFCEQDWNTVQATYPKDSQSKDVNIKSCFLSAYAYSFLVDGLKIPKDKPITIQKEVDGSEIEWALGAAYKEAADLLKRTNLRPT